MLHLEPGTRQQVLRLESKKVSHRKRVDQALFAAVGMRHVIDELDLIGLRRPIVGDEPMTPGHAPAIRHDELGFLTKFEPSRLIDERVERRIEEVEDERSSIHQMPANAPEACELVLDGDQMLERAKRDRDQGEDAIKLEG